MASIKIPFFKGAIPAAPDHLLPTEHASTAINARLTDGRLRPLENTQDAATQPQLPAITRTLFKYNNKWFAWSQRVSAMRSPVNEDPYDRVYFTGTDQPRYTRNDIANGAGILPSASFPLGVPAPSVVNVSYTPPTEQNPDIKDDSTRYYVRTFVTRMGEESAPSPLSGMVVVKRPGDSVALSWAALASNVHDITLQRIYRSITGVSGGDFRLVAELPVATTSTTDTLLDEQLGAALATIDYAQPPSGLQGLCAIVGGIALGFVGRTLYVSEPFEPYTFPKKYQQTIEWPIVAIVPLGQGAVILTEGNPYLLSGSMPSALSLDRISDPYPCIAACSAVELQGAVIYASHDGLVRISFSGAQLLSESVFSPEFWRSLSPTTMHAYAHDGTYIAFYGDVTNTGAGTGCFVMDLNRRDIMFSSIYATAGYRDLASDALWLVRGGKLVEWRKGALLPYTWKSKRFELTKPESMARMRIRSANNANLRVRLLGDNNAVIFDRVLATHTPEAFALPDGLHESYQIELIGSATVLGVGIASSMDEV